MVPRTNTQYELVEQIETDPSIVLEEGNIHDNNSDRTVPSSVPSSTNNDNENPANTENDNNTDSIDESNNNNPKKLVVASGVGTALVSLVLLGPVFSVLLGFAAAYAAEKKPDGNCIGDSARTVGEIALYATDKFERINNKHKVTEHTNRITKESYKKVEVYDRKYGFVLHRMQKAIVRVWNNTCDFVQRNNLMERGVQEIGRPVCLVVERVATHFSSSSSTSKEESSKQNSTVTSDESCCCGTSYSVDQNDMAITDTNQNNINTTSLPSYKSVPF